MIDDPHSINRVSRFALGLLFIYHGLVPKILVVSNTELELIDALGLPLPAEFLAMVAGVAEVILGVLIVFSKQGRFVLVCAAASLISLLAYVAWAQPYLLAEAFNPVSINLTGLALCYIAYKTSFTTGSVVSNR